MIRLRHVMLGVLAGLLLAGCEIQGGVARPGAATPPAATEPIELTTPTGAVATAAAVTVTPLVAEGGLRIGMLSEPADVLPYYADSSAERVGAPISQLLFPAPLLALSYTYTTTGVLERVPSVENGDVQLTMVDAYLDSSGAITTTATATITQVQQISVTFRWNQTLRWSDGAPLTADDSLFAYELAQQADLGDDARARLALLESYTKVDTYTTRAVLKPDFSDPAYITCFWTPLPRHLLNGSDPAALRGSAFATVPVGYGPYLIERRDQGSIRLRRNPHYPGPPQGADMITFVFRGSTEVLGSSVSGGSLDVAMLDQPDPQEVRGLRDAAESGALELRAAPGPIWEHLDFNLDVPLLQDIRVRRAIGHALDRQAMVDQLTGGYGAVLDSWIVAGQPYAAPADQLTRYPYNPDEARRLLDEGGFVDSDGNGLREAQGQPITLTLLTTAGSPLRTAAAERIRADLGAVGLAVELRALPTAELYSPEGPLFRRGFDLALFAWIAAPDPRGWERWSCAGVPNEGNGWAGNNFSGWCFFEADQAIRTATTTIDPAVRAPSYVRQQQLFTQELPVLPLFQRVDITIIAPSLAGVQPDPTAPFTWNIAEWQRR